LVQAWSFLQDLLRKRGENSKRLQGRSRRPNSVEPRTVTVWNSAGWERKLRLAGLAPCHPEPEFWRRTCRKWFWKRLPTDRWRRRNSFVQGQAIASFVDCDGRHGVTRLALSGGEEKADSRTTTRRMCVRIAPGCVRSPPPLPKPNKKRLFYAAESAIRGRVSNWRPVLRLVFARRGL